MGRGFPQCPFSLKYREGHQLSRLIVNELIEHAGPILAHPDHSPPP